MAGLLDLFGSGGATDPGALYNGLLTPQQNQALAYRGLLAAAGALGQAAMPSRMPIPTGAALGSAAGAMGQAQDTAALNAMRGSLLGLQGRELGAKIGLYNSASQPLPPMYEGGTAPAAGGLLGSPAPNANVSASGSTPAVSGSDEIINYGKQVAAKYGIPWDVFSHQIAGESSWNPNVGTSSAGAQGIAQFIPATAKTYGVDVNDWKSSLDGAGRYMSDLYKQGGSWQAALTGYLSGNPRDSALTSVTKINPQYRAAYAAARSADSAPTQVAQANTGTATDTVPDNPYAGTQGQGIYVPPGGKGAFDIATNKPVAPGGLPAAPQGLLAPQAAGSDTLRVGGALAQHGAGLLGFPSTPGASPPAAASPQGLLAPQAPQAAPPVLRASAVPSAPAGGPQLGGISPAYIAAAQQRAHQYAVLGLPVPADIAAAAALPFVGPKAGIEAAAQYPYKVGEAVAPQVDAAGFVAPPSLGGRGVPGLGGGTSGSTLAPAGPAPAASVPNSSPGQVLGVMNDAQKMILQRGLDETDKRLNEAGGYHAEGKAAQEQIANAAAITDLLPRVRMGWNANTVQEGARIRSSLGVDSGSIKQFLGTDPTAGDELNKLFLQFSAGAVRQMGAREPGSVISLFAKAFPNLETTPNAALLMTNALRMQAQWKMDRANAADNWALNQQRNAGPTGENYQGMKGFEASFGQSNNPRDYWRAAAAMSNEPDIAWRGLDDAGKQRIFDLIPAGAQFRAGDGKLYPKPGAQ